MADSQEKTPKREDVIVRPGTDTDCEAIMDLIRELASFQGYPEAPQITAAVLRREGFSEDKSASFHTFVAEQKSTGGIIGYALFSPFFSTWRGRGMFLEDLYLQPCYRKLGLGLLLLGHVSKFTLDNGSCQLRLSVLKTNPAKNFYERLGFDNFTVSDGWETGRFDTSALQHVVKLCDL